MRFAVLTAFAWFFFGVAQADEYRPAFLQLKQTSDTHVDMLWKVPAKGNLRLDINVELPRDAGVTAQGSSQFVNGAHIERSKITLPRGLEGTRINILGLSHVSSDVLVRVQRLDGSLQAARLNAASTFFVIEAAPGLWSVARAYLVFGIEHILEGADHLLFVACLIFVARTWTRMLLTITGFTLAHSVTLSLAALEVIKLPVPPIEAVIALSIMFVARELVLDRRDTLTWRHPIAVSATFGLLHGFGFASALGELGLPSTDIPAALLAFNVGVEVGQLLFVSTLLLAYWLLARGISVVGGRTSRWLHDIETPVGYCVGAIAMFWVLQRTSGFWN